MNELQLDAQIDLIIEQLDALNALLDAKIKERNEAKKKTQAIKDISDKF